MSILPTLGIAVMWDAGKGLQNWLSEDAGLSWASGPRLSLGSKLV